MPDQGWAYGDLWDELGDQDKTSGDGMAWVDAVVAAGWACAMGGLLFRVRLRRRNFWVKKG